ncbi:hypothetical protein BURKHO8Y_190087 [Burkholderia sp. 8Y]|nr:hypothetical protein BURKHO8Y_190087 [Burkholderia sp. 8Y]
MKRCCVGWRKQALEGEPRAEDGLNVLCARFSKKRVKKFRFYQQKVFTTSKTAYRISFLFCKGV